MSLIVLFTCCNFDVGQILNFILSNAKNNYRRVKMSNRESKYFSTGVSIKYSDYLILYSGFIYEFLLLMRINL